MNKYTAIKTVGDVILSLSTDDKEYMTWFLTGDKTPSAPPDRRADGYPIDYESLKKDIEKYLRYCRKMNTRR